jgi:signal transduction histidine kinase
MKNAFLAAVSHELRTPLSAVLGYALTLERPDISLPPEDQKDLTHRLAINARKLERLLSDLLDLDRLARGVLEPRRRATDLSALTIRVIEEADLGGHHVDVDVEPVVVQIDASKVERVVENLLVNAAKHTSPHSRIWLHAARRKEGVQITVEDEGPGVPDELKAAVFEPFRKGHAPGQHVPGTGIGLSLVARFAELHGGRAWVEDRSGGGASFSVYIPGAIS